MVGMTSIRKAVIPVAGLGTRFLPATKAQPKEMLPLVDKPVIQYVVEEAIHAGITGIVLVTGRGKQAIENHFDVAYELEHTLRERGKTEDLALVRGIAQLAQFAGGDDQGGFTVEDLLLGADDVATDGAHGTLFAV